MLKTLLEGEPFPDDFWNYKVNPILGYNYEGKERVLKLEQKKYAR